MTSFTTPGRSVAFVCHDHMMESMLDDVARQLDAQGIEVIRGPRTRPGPKLSYDPAQYAALFGRVDVAMFSSRSHCPAELMDAAPRLRAIANISIGVETVDVDAATGRGILVGHAATVQNRTALAEATVMLVLMQCYRPQWSSEVLHGTRPRPDASAAGRWAVLLSGRTVGLVGLGRIGREVAQRLRGFGVRILASGRPGSRPEAPEGVEVVELDVLLRESDIVSLHVALEPDAPPVIGAAELARMKPTAHLVNTARGEAIDEQALYQALVQHRIAGAALDTFRIEPLPEDSPLRTLDNVFLTPHLVAHTRDSFSVLPSVALENLTRPLRGELPLYCKNPEAIDRWRQRLARLALAH